MKAAIKSEFRKLLTIRSTYILTGLALLLVFLFAFYIEGFKLHAADYARPTLLSDAVSGAVTTVSIFSTIIIVLLVTHEYRYNTIMYSLLNSNKRTKVLASKVVVTTVFSLLFTATIAVLSPLMTYLGVKAAGHAPGHQDLQVLDLAWRSLFYGWAYAMFGLIIATLARAQVAAIAALFIVPGAIEQLLALLLKSNYVYLPFSALSQVLGESMRYNASLAPSKAAYVVLAYIAVLLIVANILFNRRDAN